MGRPPMGGLPWESIMNLLADLFRSLRKSWVAGRESEESSTGVQEDSELMKFRSGCQHDNPEAGEV